MNYLAQGCIIGRFQGQELVSTQDERRPISLACWKSLKFVKYFETLGKQWRVSVRVLVNSGELLRLST